MAVPPTIQKAGFGIWIEFAWGMIYRSVNFRRIYEVIVYPKIKDFCSAARYSAEILTILGSYFGRNDDFINSFWNLLTFRYLPFYTACLNSSISSICLHNFKKYVIHITNKNICLYGYFIQCIYLFLWIFLPCSVIPYCVIIRYSRLLVKG